MVETMTFEEMKQQCKSEWVLIGDPVTDERMHVLSGALLCHSRDRAEVYRRGIELRPQSACVLFLGHNPDNVEFLI
jgi:hypothetical protein